MPSGDYLVWIDLEMTGLKPATDAIIEIATVVTDRDLNLIADGPVLAIHQPEEVLAPAGPRIRAGAGARQPHPRRRSAAAHARIPCAARHGGQLAHVRQQHLPGPAL